MFGEEMGQGREGGGERGGLLWLNGEKKRFFSRSIAGWAWDLYKV